MRSRAPLCALALLAAGCGHVGYDGEVNNSIPPTPPGQVQGASSGAGSKASDLPSSYPQPKNAQAEPADDSKASGEIATAEEGKPAEAAQATEEPKAGEEPKPTAPTSEPTEQDAGGEADPARKPDQGQ